MNEIKTIKDAKKKLKKIRWLQDGKELEAVGRIVAPESSPYGYYHLHEHRRAKQGWLAIDPKKVVEVSEVEK